MTATATMRALLNKIDTAESDAQRAKLWQWIKVQATDAEAAYRNHPSGTSCDVFAFAKAGGPRPRPRAVPAPTGDEFDEPRARRQPVGGFDPI